MTTKCCLCYKKYVTVYAVLVWSISVEDVFSIILYLSNAKVLSVVKASFFPIALL